MKRGGGDEASASALTGGGARGTNGVDASGFLSGGSASSKGFAGGDVGFTPGRVVVDKNDQLVSS